MLVSDAYGLRTGSDGSDIYLLCNLKKYLFLFDVYNCLPA